MKKLILFTVVAFSFGFAKLDETKTNIVTNIEVKMPKVFGLKCYDTRKTADKFGVSDRDFHREVKKAIIKEYLKNGGKLRCDNPDICFDGDEIVLVCKKAGTKHYTGLKYQRFK